MAASNGKQPPLLMTPPKPTVTLRPGWREYTTVTGYTIGYRTLPADFMAALRSRVEGEHAEGKPAIPTTTVPTPDGEQQVPVDVNGEIHDPALLEQVRAYKTALAAWEGEVSAALTREMQAVLLRTLKFEVDAEAVAEIRDLYALTSEDLSDESDAYVMLWRVILTDQGDQTAVSMSLQGISVEEAAGRAHAMFRRTMERAFDQGS
jgi:hypothetical protein